MENKNYKEIDLKKPNHPEDIIIKVPPSKSGNFDLLSGKSIKPSEDNAKGDVTASTDKSHNEFDLATSVRKNSSEFNLELKEVKVKEFELKKRNKG